MDKPEKCEVEVPATSANLGVGFDCLGLALTLWNRFTFEPLDGRGLMELPSPIPLAAGHGAAELKGSMAQALAAVPTPVIEGCEPRFQGPDNLAWTTFRDVLFSLGMAPGPYRLTIEGDIPLSGGLGSSSTCVVAGVAAALMAVRGSFDRDHGLELACLVEGHPDNVAPAILGGVTSSFVDERGEVTSLRASVDPRWRFVVMAPPYEVRTADARRVLPDQVPTATAVWQMGRAIATVRALKTGDGALLAKACDDRLHEPYRRVLIPDYGFLRTLCLEKGASAFWISGSGSTMVAACLGDGKAQEVEAAVARERGRRCPADLWLRVLGDCDHGARVL